MNASPPEISYRVLIVDDNRAIHEDFRKILAGRTDVRPVSAAEIALFGAPDDVATLPTLQLEFAYQGEEAFEMVKRARAEDRPYAMAFMDVRMPPGWDGIETTARIWTVEPDLQIVVCTAYSDYSREQMIKKLGRSDKLLILKKPFDNVEALQLVAALTEKWQLTQQVRRQMQELEETVCRRTEQLRKSEERYRVITENAGDLIAIVAGAGRWIYRSPSFERLLGYTADELTGLSARDLIHPDDRAAAVGVMRACARRGVRITCVFRVRHKCGAWLTMESHASPFRDVSGEVEGALFVAHDISERHKMELRLRQAQKLESIGQLAAGIAHEINTPLQFIGDNTRFLQSTFADLGPLLKAYSALLSASEAGTVTQPMLAAARSAETAASLDYLLCEIPKAINETLEGVKRTTKIVHAMKTFSHPGSAERTPVDLREAVESTITISRSEWRPVAEVVTDFAQELPSVPLFAAEFNQALLNLIINATHAITDVVGSGGKGKGIITISVHPVGASVELRVRDTGTGIPEAVQRRIFDPFFTTKPLGKGTGQGLSLARSVIVGQHGGSLEFETVVGEGTVFIIRVPLQPTGADATSGSENSDA